MRLLDLKRLITTQKIARAILGKNFFGIEEWKFFYGMELSNKQLRKLPEFPWSKKILYAPCPFHKDKTVKETHFAFLGIDFFKSKPLTILKWHEIHPPGSQPRFIYYSPILCWYNEEKFSKEYTCRLRWYLMPLEILPNSTEKSYQEQLTMLPPEYEVPLAIEEVTKLFLYYRKNHIYLNPTKAGRCQDITSDNQRVFVGLFDSSGLKIGRYWDGVDYYFGLAASRKF